MKNIYILSIAFLFLIGCAEYDIIIRDGILYDGTGSKPFTGDIGIKNDKIVKISKSIDSQAKEEVDASGLAVSPGFINMLSWATTSLIRDGRSLSDIKQGVTLEVFGEGASMGPLNETMREQQQNNTDDYTIDWTTLGEYLESLERRGVSTNCLLYTSPSPRD